ncbi:MAG: GNAT family N-acetyltransferase [Methanomassiliicoccus sp.]|nr:GNAT family N-acetyltransferase [Methanomassiliicoccus sp.]
MPIRPLVPSDLPEVLAVQRSAYPEVLLESSASFDRKIKLWGRGALGGFDDDVLAAYLFCHPWALGEVAPLDARNMVLPERPDCLYVHDLAVYADHRGKGWGDRLVREALAIAQEQDLGACALVAVQRSRPFWERHGFLVQRDLQYAAGIDAHYMVRRASTGDGRNKGEDQRPSSGTG